MLSEAFLEGLLSKLNSWPTIEKMPVKNKSHYETYGIYFDQLLTFQPNLLHKTTPTVSMKQDGRQENI